MKRSFLWLLLLILIAVASVACSGIGSKKPAAQTTRQPQATPNLQATIDEAVASTCGVRADLQATEASLNATATAIAIVELQTVAVAELAEDELAALIAERVQMANKAAALAADKSLEAVKDGTIDEKEQEILYTYWYYADEMIAYADEGLSAYFVRFSELAAGTLAPLKAVDADLQAISQQVQTALPILEQIGQALAQGKGQKDKVLRQIGNAAETVKEKITDAQVQVQTWSASLPPAVQQRVAQFLAVKPKGVAKNRKAAVNKANDYIKTARAACVDQKITQAEMTKIAQQGANAAASLTKKGGTELAPLAGSVNEITAQIASGQLPAAQANLDSFQAALPAKP